MALWGLIGSTAKLAAQYEGRESASDRAARKEAAASAKRRKGHRNGGAARAAREGQAWTDRQFR